MDSKTEWIQEHQAGELWCSHYPTYTFMLGPHQPLLLAGVLGISKQTPQLGNGVLGIGKQSATSGKCCTWGESGDARQGTGCVMGYGLP